MVAVLDVEVVEMVVVAAGMHLPHRVRLLDASLVRGEEEVLVPLDQ